jgi:hypothetical protein
MGALGLQLGMNTWRIISPLRDGVDGANAPQKLDICAGASRRLPIPLGIITR